MLLTPNVDNDLDNGSGTLLVDTSGAGTRDPRRIRLYFALLSEINISRVAHQALFGLRRKLRGL